MLKKKQPNLRAVKFNSVIKKKTVFENLDAKQTGDFSMKHSSRKSTEPN